MSKKRITDLSKQIREADVTGELTFYDIQRMVISERWEAGELIIRFIRVDDRSSVIPLKIELIEAGRLANDHLFSRGVNKET